jgi:small-conductance mechanosensitive channel
MRPFLHAAAIFLMAAVLAGPATAASPPARAPAGETNGVGDEASLVVFNRQIIVFRAPFLGIGPTPRVARARLVIEETLRQGGDLVVAVKPDPQGQLVMIDDKLAFVVTPGDVDPLLQETAETAAQAAAKRLETVVAETREARSARSLLMALAASAVATAVFLALLWLLGRLRTWLTRVTVAAAERKAESLKVGGLQVIEVRFLIPLLQRVLQVLRWLLIALLTYEWLGFVLSRFPYTRPWGERLNDYLLGIAGNFVDGILGAIPGLGVAVAIFFVARSFIGFLGRFFERAAKAEAPLGGLAPETMPMTRRLVSIGIWLFALAMAYPYLPGAQTEAFKGLSVLLGLMVSLGASSVVGQGAAGLILIYTRTIRPGEYVRVGEHEGTVTVLGMFTTRIRTGLGEELTLPNSLITGSVTKNYSRAVQGQGFIVDTTVTIGYDTPWRQVEAMLVEAARRTPGILETPAPRVFQTALSDFYPEYRLVAQAVTEGAHPRAQVMTNLHANIQDVFNEYGVQIMSPHYLGDPADAKMVRPDDWYPAPAKKD